MTKKFFVKRSDITAHSFWAYNTYKNYSSVEDYFELDSYESLWGLFYFQNGKDLTWYNEVIDRYIEEHYPGKDYDESVSLLTEDDYKEIIVRYRGQYITIDYDEEIQFVNNLRQSVRNNNVFLKHFQSLTEEQQVDLITAAVLSTGSVATWYIYAIDEVFDKNADRLTVQRY